jgi:hypothetical protein
MNDKTKQYLRMAEKNLGRIVVGVLGVILLGLAYSIYSEQTSTAGLDAGAGKPAVLDDPLPKNPNFKRVAAMAEPQDMGKHPAIQQVAQYNMFDYKSVRDKQEIERGADQKFAQAQDAAGKGQAEEAKRLLGEILKQVPTHKKARELLDKLNASSGGAKGAAAPGAAPSPAAGAAPGTAPAAPTPAI